MKKLEGTLKLYSGSMPKNPNDEPEGELLLVLAPLATVDFSQMYLPTAEDWRCFFGEWDIDDSKCFKD